MFGFGRKKLSAQQAAARSVSLVSTGMLFLMTVSRRLSVAQTCVALNAVHEFMGEQESERTAYLLTDHLAEMDKTNPYSIVEYFEKGKELEIANQRTILFHILMVAILDEAQDQRLLGIVGDFSRSMTGDTKMVKQLLDIAFQESTAHQTLAPYYQGVNEAMTILQRALARSTPPPAPSGNAE
jgi:hypothetical protein